MPSIKGKKRSNRALSTRRERKRKRSSGKVIAKDDGGAYFEVERILDHRKKKGVDQFLIKWVDYEEPTWESEDVLCDSAYDDAMRLVQAKKDNEFLKCTTQETETDASLVAETEKGTVVEDVLEVEVEPEQMDEIAPAEEMDIKPSGSIQDVEDKTVDWADTSQIEYRPIERISVHDVGVAQRVKAAREAGVPLCLVGHVGWAQFAQPWLSKAPKDDANICDDRNSDEIQLVNIESSAGNTVNDQSMMIPQEQKHHVVESAGENSAAPNVENTTIDHSGTPNFEKAQHYTKEESRQIGPFAGDVLNDQSMMIQKDLESAGEISAAPNVENTTSDQSDIPKVEEARQIRDEESNIPAYIVSPTLDGDLLDLSDPHVLDVQKMIECIGNESVPIQRKSDKLGDDPNQHRVSLKLFIEKCWPEPGKELNSAMAARYLHQWQFPLSETAVPKLCNKCNPLPNGILGMDLLRLWHDRKQFLGDSPYQYIFMGNKGTMSKLHSDRGGLMITIAPIVGEKEVVLVHRSDGDTSLYDLDGDLEKPDLHHFPLIPTARVWKTVVKPGEILIMPQGTFHQCRNLTPCLSYSRFYLDDVNMKAFLQSYFDRDALDLGHEDLLWNVCFELHSLVSSYTDEARKKWLLGGKTEDVPSNIVEIVSTLRKLRNAARHVEIHFIRVSKSAHVDWRKMVLDIDVTLHNYRYRYFQKQPRLPRKTCKHAKELQREEPPTPISLEVTAPLNCPINLYRDQVKISPEHEGTVIADSVLLNPGDHVSIKDHGYYFNGVIQEVKEDLKAAYIKFNDLSDYCSQYIPFEYLRSAVSDEAFPPTSTPITGSTVHFKESGRLYQACIRSWRCGTLYKLTIKLEQGQQFDRWFTRESFLSKISNPEHLHVVSNQL